MPWPRVSQATLGDLYTNPYPAKSVLIVDNNASPQERQVLIAFAQEMGGNLLQHVMKVPGPIHMEVLRAGADQHSVRARLKAGDFRHFGNRAIGEKDHLCQNETTFYSALTQTTHAMPAVAVADEYCGQDLGVVWTLDKRSAFVGTFATKQMVASR